MVFLRIFLMTFVASFLACQVAAQETSQETDFSELNRTIEQIEEVDLIPIKTESPRSTVQTFYRLRADLEEALAAYWQHQSSANMADIAFVMEQLRLLIDLSRVPLSSRRETGSETVLYLLDILGRSKPFDATISITDMGPRI